jgi:guanine deaminase
MPETDFIERAAALALRKMRDNQGGPFGALIVRDGEVIAEGWNQVTSASDPTAHAEVVAIRKACVGLKTFSLDGCDIYTNCEPCPMCLGAIYWAHIRCIYYSSTRVDAARIGFDDDFIYREIGIAPDRRTIPAIRVPSETSDLAFSEWARSPEKQRY